MSAVRIIIIMAMMGVSTALLTDCQSPDSDPYQQPLTFNNDESTDQDTSSPSWQQQIEEVSQSLPPKEQALLANYAARRQYNKAAAQASRSTQTDNTAKQSAALATPTTITVAQALREQQIYERAHPFNPTGKPLSLAERYPIIVISTPMMPPTSIARLVDKDTNRRTKLANADTGLSSHWELALLNLSPDTIKTFKGTLRPLFKLADISPLRGDQISDVISPKVMTTPARPFYRLTLPSPPPTAADHAATVTISVPLTQFVPPIPTNESGAFIAPVPMTLPYQLTSDQALHPQGLEWIITEGQVTLTDGQVITIGSSSAQ